MKIYKYTFRFHIIGFMGSEKTGDFSVECFDSKSAERKLTNLLREQGIWLPYEKLKLTLTDTEEVAEI